MSTFTFMGRELDSNGFLRDTVNVSKALASYARLEQPLAPDTDLTQAEQKMIQGHMSIILMMPRFATDDFWSTFAANHLSALASAIRDLSITTQPQALATLIQILSLFPDPKNEPYFRRFLHHSPQSDGLATLVAAAFLRGIEWKHPSGVGPICTLITHFLHWCDTNRGDDGKASIDAAVRRTLIEELDAIKTSPEFFNIPSKQRTEMKRLLRMLKTIERMPGNTFLSSTRQQFEQQLKQCTNPSCTKAARLTCSRCKSIRYCDKTCQKWHWKNRHKFRCFQTTF